MHIDKKEEGYKWKMADQDVVTSADLTFTAFLKQMSPVLVTHSEEELAVNYKKTECIMTEERKMWVNTMKTSKLSQEIQFSMQS